MFFVFVWYGFFGFQMVLVNKLAEYKICDIINVNQIDSFRE